MWIIRTIWTRQLKLFAPEIYEKKLVFENFRGKYNFFVFAPEISLISGFLNDFPGKSFFYFSLENCSFKCFPILKVLDLGLGKHVSSVHGRECPANDPSRFRCLNKIFKWDGETVFKFFGQKWQNLRITYLWSTCFSKKIDE